MTAVLHTALEWLSRGVVPVPLKPRSKRPAIPWQALREHVPPESLVRRWFSEPDRGLGLMCGEVSDNLVVLDFDKVLAYHRWARACRDLAESYTVRTGKGYHVYLKVEDLPALTYAMPGDMGDVKVTGYVVAPPSVHASGVPYVAVNENPILQVQDLEEAGFSVPVADAIPPTTRLEEWSGGSLIDEIKAQLPLVLYLNHITRLHPNSPDGIWLMANCPFHDDQNPSMWVNAKLGICRCFKPGCPGNNRVMDLINVHALRTGMDSSHAIQDLVAELGL